MVAQENGELAVADWLVQVRAQPPAADKATIINLALRFANTGSLRDYFALISARTLPLPEADIPTPPGVANLHQTFREALAAIAKGRATPEQKAAWIEAANSVLEIPGPGKELRYVQVASRPPPDGMAALVLKWFLEPEPKGKRNSRISFGRRLCFCRYSKCATPFFLAKPPTKPGRWRLRYCDHPDDHMKKAHDEGGTKRSQKSRGRHK